jgi:hypothetical protein
MTWVRKLPLKRTIDRVCIPIGNTIIQVRRLLFKSRNEESATNLGKLRLIADRDAIHDLVARTTLRVSNKGIQTGNIQGRAIVNEKAKQ